MRRSWEMNKGVWAYFGSNHLDFFSVQVIRTYFKINFTVFDNIFKPDLSTYFENTNLDPRIVSSQQSINSWADGVRKRYDSIKANILKRMHTLELEFRTQGIRLVNWWQIYIYVIIVLNCCIQITTSQGLNMAKQFDRTFYMLNYRNCCWIRFDESCSQHDITAFRYFISNGYTRPVVRSRVTHRRPNDTLVGRFRVKLTHQSVLRWIWTDELNNTIITTALWLMLTYAQYNVMKFVFAGWWRVLRLFILVNQSIDQSTNQQVNLYSASSLNVSNALV